MSSITLSTSGMCLQGMSKQALVRSLEIFNPTTLADTSEEKCFDSTPREGIAVEKKNNLDGESVEIMTDKK